MTDLLGKAGNSENKRTVIIVLFLKLNYLLSYGMLPLGLPIAIITLFQIEIQVRS